MKRTKLMLGDNIESLKKLPDNSIDSIVSDPPYGLSFMNKKWDYDVPSVEFWKEVYRVLKPGGHVLSFGGTRTYHRMTVNIEDAGFEIRDQIMWLYGSGFPKSHNIGKAVDKLQGNDRVGGKVTTRSIDGNSYGSTDTRWDVEASKGQSPYEGWGTALKPANEPICVARKPLSEKSVAENVLKWGTGGINVDGCRVGSEMIQSSLVKPEKNTHHNYTGTDDSNALYDEDGNRLKGEVNEGRFPANIILECICDEVIKGEKGEVKKTTRGKSFGDVTYGDLDRNKIVEGIDNYNDKGDIHTNPMCPCYLMDEQSGVSKPKKERTGRKGGTNESDFSKAISADPDFIGRWPGDNGGGASRFFYQAKVSKAERNMGLDEFEGKEQFGQDGKQKCSKCNKWNSAGDNRELCSCEEPEWIRPINKNTHPTVKPVSLMAYLCRLITPPNGIVLDPFMGSGSTGIAAQLEGFRFCGMEMDEDYFKIASARIENFEEYRKFLKK
jgi:site-specific DNA-methyltransferase (adenine-specific)